MGQKRAAVHLALSPVHAGGCPAGPGLRRSGSGPTTGRARFCQGNPVSDILTDIFGSTPLRYRAIWISDIHLGTRGCKADYLLDFLRHTDALTIYLVGDIVDCWRLRKSWYWPQSHNDVVQKL